MREILLLECEQLKVEVVEEKVNVALLEPMLPFATAFGTDSGPQLARYLDQIAGDSAAFGQGDGKQGRVNLVFGSVELVLFEWAQLNKEVQV